MHILLYVFTSAVVLLFIGSNEAGATGGKTFYLGNSHSRCEQLLTLHDPIDGVSTNHHDLDFLPYCKIRVRYFRDNGLRIPHDSQTESILIETQVKLQRVLTHDEIRELLPKILMVTGEKLETVGLPQSHCFTAQMKVMTPTGQEVPISKLRPGDPVVSVDLSTGNPVSNIVRNVIDTQNQEFVTLISQLRPLQVTASEPFLTDGGVFKPLAQIPETGSLFQFDAKKLKGLLVPVPRGDFLTCPLTTTVYNLELVGEPRNFVIEGLLVHNKIAGVTL